MNAAEFNALYEVGVLVFAYPGARREDIPSATRLVTRTRSKAEVLGGHTDVVWVDGHGACIALTHVDVVPEDEWEAAREAEQTAAAAEAARKAQEPDADALSPERLAEYASLIERTTPMGAVVASPGMAAALLAEVQRLTLETAEFASRVNELESRICECEPVRGHRDLRRPAFYQRAADCPVNAEVSS